jgi:phage gp29-like protein
MLEHGFAPPGSPGTGMLPQASVKFIYRDLPIVSIATKWTVEQVRGALGANLTGNFYAPAMLCDEILGDDRVQATMGSRVAGLMSRETIFEPANDSRAAKEVMISFAECWDDLGSYGTQGWLHAYGVMMGWSSAQLVWDTTGPVWKPQLRPWHPIYTYYHWTLRRFIALSQDGQIAIEPGNGKWVLHAPWGDYRAWVFGALRAVAEPWLGRHYAYRDWMRYSEVHGIPIKLASAPASADPTQRAAFEQNLLNIPSETTVLLNKGLEGQGSDYNLELLEATDTAWESFPGLIDRSDMSIVLAILFQNLTTEVKGGSLGATAAHMDILQRGAERDDTAMSTTYRQVTRPFAAINYGDAALAPKVRRDMKSSAVHKEQATLASLLGQMLTSMRTAGIRLKKPRAFVKGFGIDIGPYEHVQPVQVEAKLAGAVGQADEGAENGEGGDNSGNDMPDSAPKNDDKPAKKPPAKKPGKMPPAPKTPKTPKMPPADKDDE